MSTYILNDLDDLEKDKINHPDRPLPRGDVTTTFVVILYYVCLALALLTTRMFVGRDESAFLYYLGFFACINYRYVVDYLPLLKPAYVAATTTIPVFIVISFYASDRPRLVYVSIALFLSMLGRELCKDLPDRTGDPESPLHLIDPRTVAQVAFALQAAALLVLWRATHGAVALLIVLTMTLILAGAYTYWFRCRRYTIALALMKVIVLFGLFFLL